VEYHCGSFVVGSLRTTDASNLAGTFLMMRVIAAESKPFLHTWSLGIEDQRYSFFRQFYWLLDACIVPEYFLAATVGIRRFSNDWCCANDQVCLCGKNGRSDINSQNTCAFWIGWPWGVGDHINPCSHSHGIKPR